MSELDAVVNKLIREYKETHAISDTPHVFQSSARAGAYNLAEVREDASVLLHQLTNLAKDGVEESERIEVEDPPLLVLAKRVRTFTTYFVGMKKDKPVFSYQEFLAARLNFAQAEQMVTTLGDTDLFALPASERRAVANRSSW
jgi:hypothetical protein